MSDYSTTTVEMTRLIQAPVEMVFDAWLNSDVMRKWLFTTEETNKSATNEPVEGGTWEIIDHREGTDYRGIGSYIKIERPTTLFFTFKMPQFSESEDTIQVTFAEQENNCLMIFTHEIIVPHEPEWTKKDIEKALHEYNLQTEQGWSKMFDNLKQIVEVSY
jgi:uncharacterized protein YndB with AHSA1/START domain